MASGAMLVALCVVLGSNHYHVPVRVLVAIRSVEGGQAGLEHSNNNGSRDLGGWQINDGALASLAKSWGVSEEEARKQVRDDDCVNALTAAFKLREKINACGGLLCGIAWYNSANPVYGQPYLQKVLAKMREQAPIFDQYGAAK